MDNCPKFRKLTLPNIFAWCSFEYYNWTFSNTDSQNDVLAHLVKGSNNCLCPKLYHCSTYLYNHAICQLIGA